MKEIMDLLVNKARYVILIITDKWSGIMSLHGTGNVLKLRTCHTQLKLIIERI